MFINAIAEKPIEVAMNEKDYTTGNFLQWYINEQIEEEKTMSTILDKINLIGNEHGGLFHIDKELGLMAAAPVEAKAE